MNSIKNGCYWLMRGLWFCREVGDLADDVQKLQENYQDQVVNASDVVKVACQIGTVAFDFYVTKKDWEAPDLEHKIQIKQGDVEKIQKELEKNKATSARLQAMALGTSILHDQLEEGKSTWNQCTIARLIGFVRKNGEVPIEQRMIGSVACLPVMTVGALTVDACVRGFDAWYEIYGQHANHISFEVNYEGIPEAHRDNAVFGRYTCDLTGRPMRFPVTAPNHNGERNHHFERSAIIEWLRGHRTNPVNGVPLRLHELRENLQMRQLIEQEMTNVGIL
ncbi:U-box domain-containing protein 7 [Candidatus Protochlamydia naegleriophila]|uniref:U-box domain-containing protein 7 n=1 Tax=Candidatus Protochlamydia naegleriophila TaxID=389348 RepID=A0A0U5JFA0_9BACT|nr:U-box domain-containing protein [Candidatus Protochlamydia naegleriophila]CUI17282.1 U-box domain-containing protein 7 [Candidatus Protochlamydia naegleriophila]